METRKLAGKLKGILLSLYDDSKPVSNILVSSYDGSKPLSKKMACKVLISVHVLRFATVNAYKDIKDSG
jgi:hypothetical protein